MILQVEPVVECVEAVQQLAAAGPPGRALAAGAER